VKVKLVRLAQVAREEPDIGPTGRPGRGNYDKSLAPSRNIPSRHRLRKKYHLGGGCSWVRDSLDVRRGPKGGSDKTSLSFEKKTHEVFIA